MKANILPLKYLIFVLSFNCYFLFYKISQLTIELNDNLTPLLCMTTSMSIVVPYAIVHKICIMDCCWRRIIAN